MKPTVKLYLAGASAAALVVLAGLGAWALFGPRNAPRPVADPTARPAAASIAQYGRAVQQATEGITYVGTEAQLASPRQGYRVTFATAAPARLKAPDDAGNAARQAAWQRQFCSDALRDEMRARRVDVVSGHVVDGGGRTQYVADCVADQPGLPPVQAGPGGPLL